MRDLIGDATPEPGHLPENEVSRGPSVEAQIFGRISCQNDGKGRTAITRKLGDMSEYSSSCIDMRAAEVLISADPDVERRQAMRGGH